MRKITTQKIFRRLDLMVSRAISRVLFLKRGGFRDSFGSYISPSAHAAANSESLHQLLRPIMELMTIQEIDKPLMRLGSEFDGGYVVIDKSYEESFLISAGISNNNDFEISFANLGGHGHQVDYTVLEAPLKHENLTFSASRLVGEFSKRMSFDVTLDELYDKYIKNTKYEKKANILKMDIEGSEWEILESTTVLNKFDQVLLEIHYLERLAKEDFQKEYLAAINKLFTHFRPVAIAGNNCCGFVTIGGFSVPRVIEMSLVNRNIHPTKDLNRFENVDTLITRNYPSRAPIVLKRW